MAVMDFIRSMLGGGKGQTASKHEETRLDKEVADTFPASDPPAAVQPGSGITGAEPRPGDPPRHTH